MLILLHPRCLDLFLDRSSTFTCFLLKRGNIDPERLEFGAFHSPEPLSMFNHKYVHFDT